MNDKKSAAPKVIMGVATLVAAAAGAYFLYGKEGAKNRTKVKGWALKMKGEVLERLEQLQDVSEEVYTKVVDEVSAQYRKLQNVDTSELEATVKDMKRHWKNIKRDVLTPKTKAKKARAK